MATNNALNKKTQELTVDPGASGDSFLQFDINATGEFRVGVDDDDGDAFKLSQGSALGTSDTFIMSAAGERTMPLQPAFLSFLGTTDSNVTGDSTGYVFGSGNALTEVFDQGGDMTTGGTFTAPRTGRYYLYCTLLCGGVTSSHTRGRVFGLTSNRTYLSGGNGCIVTATAADQLSIAISVLADMDSGDTCTMQLEVIGGTKVVDVLGQETNPISYFCGALIV